MRPGSGAARLHAGNAQRMLLAAMPKSAAAEPRARGRRCCARARAPRRSGRPASATPAVPLPSYTPEELNGGARRFRARGARPASASACCRLARGVSGESPDISATRPPSAAVSEPSRQRDPPSRPTRKLRGRRVPANIEQCASPLRAWRRYDDLARPARRRGHRDLARSHRRYVINSRQNYSQAAHTRVWGLRRPRAGGRARAQRAGARIDRPPGLRAREGPLRRAFLPRASCMLRARASRGAGGVGGASRARPRRRTAPL